MTLSIQAYTAIAILVDKMNNIYINFIVEKFRLIYRLSVDEIVYAVLVGDSPGLLSQLGAIQLGAVHPTTDLVVSVGIIAVCWIVAEYAVIHRAAFHSDRGSEHSS